MVKSWAGWVHRNQFIVMVLLVTLVLRIPSLFEPYWYGDEGIYLTVGAAINSGRVLYRDIYDNKPPLLYLTAALARGEQYWFKLIAGIWSLTTVAVFYKLAGKIWGNGQTKKAAVLIFALLTTLPVWEGNIANAELFFLLPTVAAGLLLWNEKEIGKIFAGGVVLGMGALWKAPVLAEAVVWIFVWLGQAWRKELTMEKLVVRCVSLGVGALVPLIASWVALTKFGAGEAYVSAAWMQNLPYLSSWQMGTGLGLFSVKGRLAATAAVSLLAVWLNGGILALWGLWTIFAATLSGRPYPHYLLQAAGATALAITSLGWGSRRERLVGGGVITLLVGTILMFKFWTYPTAGYYVNFLEWTLGQKSQEQYFEWFGGGVNRNYEIARVIMSGSRAQDRIFVWGDEPMIYALAKRLPEGKYTVAYHIKFYGVEAETMQALTASPPRYIVETSDMAGLPGLESLVNSRYKLEKEVGGANIYRRVLSLSLKD